MPGILFYREAPRGGLVTTSHSRTLKRIRPSLGVPLYLSWLTVDSVASVDQDLCGTDGLTLEL